MQKVNYVNSRGQSISFEGNPPYILWKVEGVANPDISLSATRTISSRGQTAHGLLYERREVDVTGHVYGPEATVYERRKALCDILSPEAAPGVLTYENDAGRFSITAFPNSPRYDERIKDYQTVAMKFICPDPVWRAESPQDNRLYFGDGVFMFALEFPVMFGLTVARGLFCNIGNVPAPLEFWIRGAAANPKIQNMTTGEQFTVSKAFDSNKTLYINTGIGEKAAYLLDENKVITENAFGYLTADSTLFLLPVGESELCFTSDNESIPASVAVRFTPRFTGL